MTENQTESRIKNINKMLLELASGNFSYKIERSDKKDDIEALVTLVNMMAEEIKESFFHQGYVNLKGTYKHLIEMAFILDETYRIQLYNNNVNRMLSYKNQELLGQPFNELLTNESKQYWVKIKSNLEKQEGNENSIKLSFKTKHNLIMPAFCSITRLSNQNNTSSKILISVIEIVKSRKSNDQGLHVRNTNFTNNKSSSKKEVLTGSEKRKIIVLKHSDVQKIREVHDYILNNLEKPLPSLNDLAHQFGTNEFKLKYSFKQLYGTTIFRFLIKERLRKASMLIQYSDMSLKIIAYKTGFISFPHFSKVFKKEYGYAPSSLRKKSLNKNI